MKPTEAHTAAIDAPDTLLRQTVLYRLRATRGTYPPERTALCQIHMPLRPTPY